MKKFSGANFCFWVSVLVVCFWCCFAYVFALCFVFFAPESVWKNSIDVRSGVFGLSSLFLWFFRRRRRPRLFCLFLFSFSFFRETDQVVTGHTPHTHLCSFAFSCLCPRRVCLFTRLGRASFLSGVLSGCHSGPRAFLGFSWYSSEAFFSDARRQGCFRSFLSVVFVFPFCCVSRLFSHQLEGADPSSYVAYTPGSSYPPRARVRARGRCRARPVGPGLNVSGYFVASLCLAEGHRDPGTLFGREGALSLPPQVPFSHTPLFFFSGPRLLCRPQACLTH